MTLKNHTFAILNQYTHVYPDRKLIIDLLPNVWILDGEFITDAERQLAAEFYSANEDDPSLVRNKFKTSVSSRPTTPANTVKISGRRSKEYTARFLTVGSSLSEAEKVKYLLYFYAEIAHLVALVKNNPFSTSELKPTEFLPSRAPIYMNVWTKLPNPMLNSFKTMLKASLIFYITEEVQVCNIFIQLLTHLSRKM